jgi:4-amino-4-deoxy-L-arabinose transferase-like glycosyltransferase
MMKVLPWILLAALTVLRLWTAAAAPVAPEDAWQWLCAKRLDTAFFDAPGGTAALVRATTTALGDGALGLRVAFPLLAALASVAAFLFARALFGAAAGIWAAAALNALPVFNSAAVHANSTLPALAFTLLAAWAFLRALDRGLPSWALSGTCLAIAANFHYSAALLWLGILAVCATSPRHRVEGRRPGIYLALAITFAGLAPAFVWNQAHGWPALALGTWRTVITPRWAEILPALGASALLLGPPAFLGWLFSLGALGRSASLHAHPRQVLGLAAPFTLLWLYGVLHGDPAGSALLLSAALTSAGVAYAFLQSASLRRTGAALLLLTAASAAWPTKPATNWHAVASALEQTLAKAQPGHEKPLFLIAPDPEATSALSYHLASRGTEVFLRESQDLSNQFGLWPRYDDFVETDKPADDFFKQEGNTTNLYLGRSALYIGEEPLDALPSAIKSAFAKVSPFAELELPGGRKLRVYLCEDYQTMPL